MTTLAEPTTTGRIPRRAGIIDTDIHLPGPPGHELMAYLPSEYHHLSSHGIGALGGHRGSGNPFGVKRRDVDWQDGGTLAVLQRQLLDKYDMTMGVVNIEGSYGIGTSPNTFHATVLASAWNEWTIDNWADVDPRIRLSLTVAPQDPNAAAKEIRKWAGHPKVAQFIITSATLIPLGDRVYWPIYEALCDVGLPLAVHPGNEGTGIGRVAASGLPSSYLEWHTNLSQNYMSQISSLVTQGVFCEYSDLRFVGLEGGFTWLPHLMWRLDADWKTLRQNAPWLKKAPSEYMVEHLRLSTQPMEEPHTHTQLMQMLELMHADKILMFSSDFPHWDNDCPENAFRRIPEPMKSRILCENAAELYGFDLED